MSYHNLALICFTQYISNSLMHFHFLYGIGITWLSQWNTACLLGHFGERQVKLAYCKFMFHSHVYSCLNSAKYNSRQLRSFIAELARHIHVKE